MALWPDHGLSFWHHPGGPFATWVQKLDDRMPQTSPNKRFSKVELTKLTLPTHRKWFGEGYHLFVAIRSTSYKVVWTDRTPFHDSLLEKASLLHRSLGKKIEQPLPFAYSWDSMGLAR